MQIKIIKKILFFLLIFFYLFAGFNHFVNPSFYTPIIPPYLALWAKEINLLSGFLEITLALLLLFKATRLFAVKGIILLLIIFIPAHVYFIQKGYFTLGPFQITPLLSYIRLIIGQPILILWVWWSSK